jgi:hypothetical protein
VDDERSKEQQIVQEREEVQGHPQSPDHQPSQVILNKVLVELLKDSTRADLTEYLSQDELSQNGFNPSQAIDDLLSRGLASQRTKRVKLKNQCKVVGRWLNSSPRGEKIHTLLIKNTIWHLVAVPIALLGIFLMTKLLNILGMSDSTAEMIVSWFEYGVLIEFSVLIIVEAFLLSIVDIIIKMRERWNEELLVKNQVHFNSNINEEDK